MSRASRLAICLASIGIMIEMMPRSPMAAQQSNAARPVHVIQAHSNQEAERPGRGFQTAPIHYDQRAELPEYAISIDEAVLTAIENNKQLQVLGFRPEIQKTLVHEAASVFDPTIGLSGQFRDRNRQLSSRLTAAGTGATSQLEQTFVSPNGYGDSLFWERRLANGANVHVGYNIDFERLDPAGAFRVVNPAWHSSVNFTFEQPLFRGNGVIANYAPIQQARELYFQSNHQVQSTMNVVIRSVRAAYWDLQAAYGALTIQATASERAFQTYEEEERRYEIGSSTRAHVAQAHELYHRFRLLELEAKQAVVERERQFRQLMGLPGFDNRRLRPEQSDSAVIFQSNWDQAVQTALGHRPEIAAQRHLIESIRYELVRLRNELMPDVSLVGGVGLNGLDSDWDGSVGEVLDADHSEWTIGIVYRRPVNNSLAQARVRRASLELGAQQAILNELEYNVIHELERVYHAVSIAGERVQIEEQRLVAADERLSASETQYRARGGGDLDYLLRAQQDQTLAALSYEDAVRAYRTAIEHWDFQRGTLMLSEMSR